MTPAASRRTSVIIAARDAERTLHETLDSLLAQTDPEWEALVVDDGSTDATPHIIADYAARDDRVAALASTGVGASAARNLALTRAEGERLLFLDSDDWVDERFLARMNRALDENGDAVAAYCGYHRVMPSGRQTPSFSDPRVGTNPFEMFARSCATKIHAVLVEREAVLAIGGFDPLLRTCEDWDLWQRIARSGRRWTHVDEALSYYRASDHSLTQDVGQMLADARIVIDRGSSGQDPSLSPGEAALAYAYFALWCGAFDCGRGSTGEIALSRIGELPATADAVDPTAEVLFDALTVGARVHPDQMASGWPGYGARITRFIAAIGDRLGDARFARRIQYRLERMILDHDDLAEPRPLALTLGLRIDLARPGEVRPPPDVDRLYVYLCNGDRILALIELGARGAIAPGYWSSLLADGLGVSQVAGASQDDPLALPPIEVRGDWSLDAFTSCTEGSR
jgi:hypothetical protein